MHIRSGNMDSVMASKALSDKYGKSATTDGSASIIFNDALKVLAYCDRLERDLAITDRQDVRPVPMYDVSSSAQTASIIAFILIALFLMFTGYLLIYNVLFISVSRDIRYYGMLKTVGTTPKQLRQIVIGQTLRLCIIGIPLGVVLAAAVSLGVVPLTVDSIGDMSVKPQVSFSPMIYLGAVGLSLLTAFIGAAKPAKKAATISPIEAMKYEGATVNGGEPHGLTNAKPYKMALRNVLRDKKRAVVVLLSLCISMTTFVTITTLVGSMDTNNYVAYHMKNDFVLKNNTAATFGEGTKQKFTPELLEKLQTIPGLEEQFIQTESLLYLTYSAAFDGYLDHFMEINGNPAGFEGVRDYFSSVIIGIGGDALADYNRRCKTDFDIAAFERGEYVLIATENPEMFAELDSIDIENRDTGATVRKEIGGFVQRFFFNSTMSVAPNIICSEELIAELVSKPIISNVSINVKKGYDVQALEYIKALTQADSAISHTSKIELQAEMRSAKLMLYCLGGGISLILGLIGIMNFVNVMSVGIMVRKRELATLESVGMLKEQMRKMLVWEGGWYAIFTLAFVATLGNLAAYGMFTLFRQEADYAIFSYPIMPVLIASVIVALLCVFTPRMAYRSIGRLTLVERLKVAE